MRARAGALLSVAACLYGGCSERFVSSSSVNVDGGPDGTAPGDAGVELSAEEGCKKIAEATCARRTACAPSLVQGPYGELAACERQVAIGCETTVRAPGSRMRAADMTACAGDLRAQGCADVVAGRQPASCRPSGDYPVGAACISDTQCASGFCSGAGSSFQSCGTCRELARAGDACDATSRCPDGFVCGPTSTCVPLRKAGESCFGDSTCDSLHHCRMSDRTCAAWSVENEACEGTVANRCAPYLGLHCSEGKCVRRPLASPGELCSGAPVPPQCVGAACIVFRTVMKCLQWANEGDSCPRIGTLGDAEDAGCMPPLRCDTSVGKCVRPSMGLCP